MGAEKDEGSTSLEAGHERLAEGGPAEAACLGLGSTSEDLRKREGRWDMEGRCHQQLSAEPPPRPDLSGRAWEPMQNTCRY